MGKKVYIRAHERPPRAPARRCSCRPTGFVTGAAPTCSSGDGRIPTEKMKPPTLVLLHGDGYAIEAEAPCCWCKALTTHTYPSYARRVHACSRDCLDKYEQELSNDLAAEMGETFEGNERS